MKESGNQKRRLKSALAVCLGAAAVTGGCGKASEGTKKDMKMLITISQMDFARRLQTRHSRQRSKRGLRWK